MPKRLILRGLFTAIAATMVAWLAVGDAEPALAFHPYHYAYQYTSQADGHFNHKDYDLGQLPAAYYGWAGINGQIKTPTSVPHLNNYRADHANGYVAISSSGGGQLQVGWMVGFGGQGNETIQADTPTKYLEHMTNSGNYDVMLVGEPLTLGEEVIYRIQRYPSDPSCWNVFVYYSQTVGLYCGLNSSGAGYAVSEVVDSPYDEFEGPVEMEVSKWGWSNPNIYKALRLMGAGGYEPWDTSLRAKYTARYDERLSDPTYYISYYNLFYYFLAYGELQ